MKYAPILFLMLLSGCMGDHGLQQMNSVEGRDVKRLDAPARIPAKDLPPAEVVDLAPLQKQLAASENKTQQSLSGLGVQLGKLADTVKGVEANVNARLDATVEAQATLALRAVADIETRLTAAVRADVDAQAHAHAEVVATLTAKIDQLAAVQAGLENTVQNQRQEISAARDANVKTVQYTREMMQTQINASDNTVKVIAIAFGAVKVMMLGTVLYMTRAHSADLKSAHEMAIAVDTDCDPTKKKTRRVEPRV